MSFSYFRYVIFSAILFFHQETGRGCGTTMFYAEELDWTKYGIWEDFINDQDNGNKAITQKKMLQHQHHLDGIDFCVYRFQKGRTKSWILTTTKHAISWSGNVLNGLLCNIWGYFMIERHLMTIDGSQNQVDLVSITFPV